MLVLAVIGPPEPYRIPVFPGCEEFELTCDGCQNLYKYHQTEVRWEHIANLPIGYKPSLTFLRAILQTRHRHSDPSE